MHQIYDLTHRIDADTMVYPGTEPAQITPANTIERDGFRETLLRLYSHTGTHMDAPAHMEKSGAYLDMLPIQRFLGRAYVLDATAFPEGARIGVSALPHEIRSGVDFLILSTGWEAHWGTPRYFGAFPTLDIEAAQALVCWGIQGLGMDTMSADPMDTVDYAIHHLLFRNGFVLIENLCNLAPLRNQMIDFAALPLAYTHADGAPVRAAARLSEPAKRL